MARSGFLRSLPTWSLLVLALAPPLLYVTLSLRLDLNLGQIVHHIALGAVTLWAFVFCGLWWERLDEASHEAQKWAAIWGGSFGLAAGLGLAILLSFSASGATWLADFAASVVERSEGRIAPTSWTFFLGVIFAATSSVVGFLVAWAFWWAKRK